MIEINKWDETFENADTRKRQRLKFILAPSGVESRGLVNLLCHFDQKDALAAFGVFQMICQLSATLPANHRGKLVHSDGTPMTEDYLARLLRLDICHLSAAMKVLRDERVAWVLPDSEKADLPPPATNLPALCKDKDKDKDSKKDSKPMSDKSDFEELWKLFPPSSRNRSSRKKLMAAITAIRGAASIADLSVELEKWVVCDMWTKEGGRFAMAADRWVRDEKWRDDPEPEQTSQPTHRELKKQKEYAEPELVIPNLMEEYEKRTK